MVFDLDGRLNLAPASLADWCDIVLPRRSAGASGEAIGDIGMACEAAVFALSRGSKSRATDDMMATLLHEWSSNPENPRVNQESKEGLIRGVTRFRPPDPRIGADRGILVVSRCRGGASLCQKNMVARKCRRDDIYTTWKVEKESRKRYQAFTRIVSGNLFSPTFLRSQSRVQI